MERQSILLLRVPGAEQESRGTVQRLLARLPEDPECGSVIAHRTLDRIWVPLIILPTNTPHVPCANPRTASETQGLSFILLRSSEPVWTQDPFPTVVHPPSGLGRSLHGIPWLARQCLLPTTVLPESRTSFLSQPVSCWARLESPIIDGKETCPSASQDCDDVCAPLV